MPWESLLIKVLYCFHQNNDDSKCEVAHTSPRWQLVLRRVPVPTVLEPGGDTWHRNQNQNQLGSYLPSRWR